MRSAQRDELIRRTRESGEMSGMRMVAALRSERGAVTAEFVVVIPAVLLILGLAIGAVLLATHRLTLTAAAAEIVRLEARGDSAAAAARLAALSLPHSVVRSEHQGLHCVTIEARPIGGVLSLIAVGSSACAVGHRREPKQEFAA